MFLDSTNIFVDFIYFPILFFFFISLGMGIYNSGQCQVQIRIDRDPNDGKQNQIWKLCKHNIIDTKQIPVHFSVIFGYISFKLFSFTFISALFRFNLNINFLFHHLELTQRLIHVLFFFNLTLLPLLQMKKWKFPSICRACPFIYI